MNESLMSAVLWTAIFFETSSDEECDPDLAVKQLEQMAFELGRLSPDEREVFRGFARRQAESDPNPELRQVLLEVAEALVGDRD